MSAELFKCGICGLKFIEKVDLVRHFRLRHRRAVNLSHLEAIISNERGILSAIPEIAPIQIAGKRSTFLGEWGRCDICGEETSRRWEFQDAVHGKIYTCSVCKEIKGRKKSKSKLNMLDSRARLPGSFGSKNG